MSDTTTTPPPAATPTPTVTLSDGELEALRKAGRSWATVPRARSLSRQGVDPDLDAVERRGALPGDRYVRSARGGRQGLQKVAPGVLQATKRAIEPKGPAGRLAYRLRRIVLGQPLATTQLVHERLTKVKALAVLSSDALSSVAYSTDLILVVLLAAGVAGYRYTLPVMGAIIVLLALVVLSYRQTIKAYPKGGGSYIVAKDNLGPVFGLIAGSALMTDYVLTVAVSVASGVSAITSAAPGISQYTVPMCLGFILIIILGNLRGIRESGSIFAAPTYIFILSIFLMIGTILVKLATGDLHHVDPAIGQTSESVGLFLILRAFSSGATALTGVEAISDGVPAFKPPEWFNARRTLVIMGTILASMFAGITLTAYLLGLTVDKNDSNILINQLATHAFGAGGNPLYYVVIGSTTAILVLAANTSFSDFPRLFWFLARDDYAPHLFKRLGDRLAFSNGIFVLGTLAAALVAGFKGDVTRLIPLYAVGVFLAFTMSQAGMVMRHWRMREEGWRVGMAFNFAGMCATAIVLVITASVKFLEGAFVVVFLVPVLVLIFLAIHRHYTDVGSLLATETPTSPALLEPISIVPVTDLNGPALQSLALARSISDNVIAVHIDDDEEAIARLRAKWEAWGNHVPLEIIESPYRSVVRPLLNYIDAIGRQRPEQTVVIVLPELVATRWWHQLLHNQTALRLKAALLFRPGTVVVNVPYHLRRVSRASRRRLRVSEDDL